MELIKAIKKTQHKVRLLLLVVTAAERETEGSWSGLGEMLSPIRAMLSTRSTRGNLVIQQALDSHLTATSLIVLNLDVFPVPLGWQLSVPSQFVIREHSGHAGRRFNFDRAGRNEKDDAIMLTLNSNDADACRVQAFLNSDYDPKTDVCSSISGP